MSLEMSSVTPTSKDLEGNTVGPVPKKSFCGALSSGFQRASAWDFFSLGLNFVFYCLFAGIIINAATDNVHFKHKAGVDYGPFGECWQNNFCESSDCPCTDSGFTKDFFFNLIFWAVSFFLNVVYSLCSVSRGLLFENLRTVDEENRNFQKLKLDVPQFWDSVHCYHKEIDLYHKKRKGKAHHRKTVTTYREKVFFEYKDCLDKTTTLDLLGLHEYPLTVIKYDMETKFMDAETIEAYRVHKEAFQARNVNRDKFVNFTDGVDLANLSSPIVLVYNDGFDISRVQLWYFVSLFLCVNSVFRFWLLGASEHYETTISKSVSIHPDPSRAPVRIPAAIISHEVTPMQYAAVVSVDNNNNQNNMNSTYNNYGNNSNEPTAGNGIPVSARPYAASTTPGYASVASVDNYHSTSAVSEPSAPPMMADVVAVGGRDVETGDSGGYASVHQEEENKN